MLTEFQTPFMDIIVQSTSCNVLHYCKTTHKIGKKKFCIKVCVGCRWLEVPPEMKKKQPNQLEVHKVTHVHKRNLLSDHDKIWQGSRHPWRNDVFTCANFGENQLRGLGGKKGVPCAPLVDKPLKSEVTWTAVAVHLSPYLKYPFESHFTFRREFFFFW